jgi:hypothetical protein
VRYVENPNTKVDVGPLGGHGDGTLTNGISVLIKEAGDGPLSLLLREDKSKRQHL